MSECFLFLLSPYFLHKSALSRARISSDQNLSSKHRAASLVSQFDFLFYLINFASQVSIVVIQTARITLVIFLRIINSRAIHLSSKALEVSFSVTLVLIY